MDAHLSVVQDVQVEDAGTTKLILASGTPSVRGEELTVRIGAADAVQITCVGRTEKSEPRVVDGRVQHRIHVEVTGPIALSTGAGASSASWRAGEPAAAVLVRRYQARVVDLSRGGCLLDLPAGLPVGTVGTLHAADVPSPEPVRIGHLRGRGGLWRSHAAGAEFLSLDAPASLSLRAMAARMVLEDGRPSMAPADHSSEALETKFAERIVETVTAAGPAARTDVQWRAERGMSDEQALGGSPIAAVDGRATAPDAHGTRAADD